MDIKTCYPEVVKQVFGLESNDYSSINGVVKT